MDNFSEQHGVSAFVQQHFIPILLGIAGLICLGYGLMQLLPQKTDKPDILFEAASDVSSVVKKPDSSVKREEITVDIEGAIQKPGVYTVKNDSRIQDGLIAAGGLSAKADRGKISKEINLAAKLTDGAKLYFPFVGEQVSVSTMGSAGGESKGNAGSLVNINTATSSELEALPGIGEVTAGKIVAGRPYSSIEELVNKKVVGKSMFEKIKESVIAQ